MPRQPYEPFEQSVYRPQFHPIPVQGVAPDLPQEQLGDRYLASALNFLVRDGRVHKREGATTRWPAGAALATNLGNLRSCVEFVSTRPPASAMMVAQFGTKFYYAAADSTAWTNISTGIATTAGLHWWTTFISASAGQQLVAQNLAPDETAYTWTGSTATSFIALATAVTGTSLIAWRNHLLMGDTTDTADGHLVTRIHWSRLGDLNTWTGTASAGSLDLNDSNATRVLALVPLRTTLIAYKEEAAHALIYKSAPFYFTQQLLDATIAPVGPFAITSIQNGQWHFILTKEGAILWDGQTIRPIGRDRVDRSMLNAITWSARNTIWATWWGLRQEVLVGMPTGGGTNPTRLWVYNMTYDAWWETDLRSFFATPSTYAASTPSLLGNFINTGDNIDSQNMWQLFTGTNEGTDSGAISASIQTGLYDYGAIEHKRIFKLAALAGPGSGSQATITIRKAGQENPLSTPSFTSAQAILVTGGAALPKIDFQRSDRWMAYRMTHTAASQTCEIAGLVPYVTERSDARKRR